MNYGPMLLIPIAIILIFTARLFPNVINLKGVAWNDVKALFKLKKEPIPWVSGILLICGLVLLFCHQQIIGTLLMFLSMLYLLRPVPWMAPFLMVCGVVLIFTCQQIVFGALLINLAILSVPFSHWRIRRRKEFGK